jgi:hypothetical protein
LRDIPNYFADGQIAQWSDAANGFVATTLTPSGFTCADIAACGIAGVEGPAGPAGADGAVGPTGPTGASGPAGPSGAVGPAGATGATGPVGPGGPEGPAGATGPAGAQGIPGLPGLPGPAGPTGATGPAGAAGTNGQDGIANWDELCDELAGVNFTCLGDIPIPTANGYLFYDGANFIWQNVTSGGGGTFSCADLNSCSITSLSDVGTINPNENVVVDGSGNITTEPKYEFTCAELGTCTLSDISNVSSDAPTNDQVLAYDSTDGLYKPTDLPSTKNFEWRLEDVECYGSVTQGGTTEQIVTTNHLETKILTHLKQAVDWAALADLPVYVGEIGIPNDVPALEQSQWNAAMDKALKFLNCSGAGWTGWATGVEWGIYNLNIYDQATGYGDTPNSQPFNDNYAGNSFISGVNFAGYEFSSGVNNDIPGAEVTLAELQTIYNKGVRWLRLPIGWHDLTGGALCAASIRTDLADAIGRFLDNANTAGFKVILDIHEYGSYGRDEGITNQNFELSDPGAIGCYFQFLDQLFAYVHNGVRIENKPAFEMLDIMNEPERVTHAEWEVASQQIVTHIRSSMNSDKWLIVATGNYSGAQDLPGVHPSGPWIVDPLNRYTPSVHYYFDDPKFGAYNQGDGQEGLTYDGENAQAQSESFVQSQAFDCAESDGITCLKYRKFVKRDPVTNDKISPVEEQYRDYGTDVVTDISTLTVCDCPCD